MNIKDFPEEILLSIFLYFDLIDLLTIKKVCKSWCRLANVNFIWKNLYFRTFEMKDKKKESLFFEDYGWKKAFQNEVIWQKKQKKIITQTIESQDSIIGIMFSRNHLFCRGAQYFYIYENGDTLNSTNENGQTDFKLKKMLRFPGQELSAFQCNKWNDRLIFLGIGQGNVYVLNSFSHEVVREFNEHKEWVSVITELHENKFFSGGDDCIKLWDLESQVCLWSSTEGTTISLLHSPAHNILAAGFYDILAFGNGNVIGWDMKSGTQIFQHQNYGDAECFVLNENNLFYGTSMGHLVGFDIRFMNENYPLFLSHEHSHIVQLATHNTQIASLSIDSGFLNLYSTTSMDSVQISTVGELGWMVTDSEKLVLYDSTGKVTISNWKGQISETFFNCPSQCSVVDVWENFIAFGSESESHSFEIYKLKF